MNFRKNMLKQVFATTLIATSVGASAALSQSQLDAFAQNTQLTFAVENNFHGGAGSFIGSISLENKSNVALPAGKSDWQIYIHSVRKIKTKQTSGLKVEHINGDLHRLIPTTSFVGLAPNQSLKVEFEAAAWIAAYTDFMPRAFIVSQDQKPAIFANTNTEDMTQFVAPFERENQLKRHSEPLDYSPLATAQWRYMHNQSAVKVDKQAAVKRIVPKPYSVDFNRGFAELDGNWQIRFAGRLKSEVAVFNEDLKAHGLSLDAQPDHIEAGKTPTIFLKVESGDYDREQAASGSYKLEIDDDKIEIIGVDNAGVFYGIQSLLALFPTEQKKTITVPNVEIEDTPRYGWRGMHYDNARNYHGKEALFKLVEQMARYKLNKFHWHFSDDEGWRVEIPGLPELSEIGGYRCFDLQERDCLLTQLGTGPFKSGSGNGYLSREDFVELLKFAKARHIDIIPEIEGPGHARAAIKAMEARYYRLKEQGLDAEAQAYLLSDLKDKSEYLTVQNYTDNSLNVCMDSTYAFIEKVTYELQGMYREAGTRLTNLHFGGDEVGAGSWEKSPACQALFKDANNGIAGPSDLKPYFTQRVAKIFAKRGIAPGAWEDGLMYDRVNPFKRDEFPNQVFTANVWDNIWEWGVADRAHRLANDGYQVILSHGTHLYFDHPYEAHPEERGYYWAARYTDTKKAFGYMPDNVYANADFTRNGESIENLEALVGRPLPKLEKPENILGMQGQVWTETIRTEDQVMAMMFPRVLTVAERAWHKAKWEGDVRDEKALAADWQEFSATLALKELTRLVNAGVNINLPVPGAVIENGQLLANSAFRYLAIEVSFDSGKTWQQYTGPMSVTDSTAVRLRTTLNGKKYSRITGLD
ncbi:carbohydate-binding domain-containing protein [Pseudoalteromonas sp. SMS1]|uniref:family 20 glycosylhydrolase n=1 Tax=Pseudoalteromonas sp. SMS1 TaxID=2908894 RepID=UPI001F2BB131|nr:family 20 glycosylhydrolase [Pseudoalteromonas sp. SMS1]MCF2857438.1 carbohydate-binding domain-containing protein [Pseudoalteromonas sp. SMS1]